MCDLEKALNLDKVKQVKYNGVVQPTIQEKVKFAQQSIMQIANCNETEALNLIDAITIDKISNIKWEH